MGSQFKVFIYNLFQITTPSKRYLELGYPHRRPFYREIWFMVTLFAASVILIIAIVAFLCVKSKSYKYKGATPTFPPTHSTTSHKPETKEKKLGKQVTQKKEVCTPTKRHRGSVSYSSFYYYYTFFCVMSSERYSISVL